MYAPSPQNVTRRLLRQGLDFLMPAPCLACGEAVDEPRQSLGLCSACRRRLERWPLDGCGRCGRPIEGAHPVDDYLCGDCRRRPPPYARSFSAWSYQPPLDAVVAGLKFRRLEYLGAQLGRAVAALLRPQLAGCELVVPVPLHWRRFLGRGYNQAAVIARPVAAELGLPLAGVLRRRRAVPPQSRLSRAERRRNLRGVFAVRRAGIRRAAACAGRRVLLVDDVETTGATLRAAAACLRQAGAKSVVALTVARTPEPA